MALLDSPRRTPACSIIYQPSDPLRICVLARNSVGLRESTPAASKPPKKTNLSCAFGRHRLIRSRQQPAIYQRNSQSLLKAIQSGSDDTTGLRRMLNIRTGKTTQLWIPGHHGIAGNEEADACVKQVAAITNDAPRPVSFAAASAFIRQTLTDPPPCCYRIKEVYTKTFSWPANCRAASTRRDGVLLTRLRAGHTPPPSA